VRVARVPSAPTLYVTRIPRIALASPGDSFCFIVLNSRNIE
jgi:hypothetical protein